MSSRYFLIMSPLKMAWSFLSSNLNCLQPRVLCVKLGWNWPCGQEKKSLRVNLQKCFGNRFECLYTCIMIYEWLPPPPPPLLPTPMCCMLYLDIAKGNSISLLQIHLIYWSVFAIRKISTRWMDTAYIDMWQNRDENKPLSNIIAHV